MPLSTMAIDSDGSVLLETDGSVPDLLAVIDTSGRLARTFVKPGSGPGELRGATPVGVSAGRSVIFDMSQMKLELYDSVGVPLRSIRPKDAGMVIPKWLINDSTVFVLTPGPHGEYLPGTMSLTTGALANLIAASDSFLQTFSDPDGGPISTRLPTTGHWLGGVVLADGNNYALGFYDWQGHWLKVITHTADRPRMTERQADETLTGLNRNPARKPLTGPDLERARDKLMKEKLPYFSHITTLTIDDQGRLWILGQAGDSGYADIFGRDGFVGRLPLSCDGFKRNWALTGHWLAITCATDNPASTSGGVLKIFRIEG